jgi:hypothetical protein
MVAILCVLALLQEPDLLPGWADPPEMGKYEWEAVKRYVASAEKWRDVQSGQINSELLALQKKIPSSGKARTERLAQIKEKKLQLELLLAKVTFPTPRIFQKSYFKDQVGHLEGSVKVSQVLDADLVVEHGNSDHLLVLEGIEVGNASDGQSLSLPDIFECVGQGNTAPPPVPRRRFSSIGSSRS